MTDAQGVVVDFLETLHIPSDQAFDIVFPGGVSHRCGVGPLSAVLQLNDWNALRRLSASEDQSIAFAEAYAAGEITILGNVSLLLGALYSSEARHRSPFPSIARDKTQDAFSPQQQRAMIEATYDDPFDLYDLILDRPTHSYTSGWFPNDIPRCDEAMGDILRRHGGGEDYKTALERWFDYQGDVQTKLLAAGQHAKIERVARKIRAGLPARARKRPRILDIGCGWGALAFHLAEQLGAEVIGLTLSGAQARYVREECTRTQLPVSVVVASFREAELGDFDAVVSIGMLEHVGEHGLAEYAEFLRSAVRDDGVCVIHCMNTVARRPMNPFIEKYIFPGSFIHPVPAMVDAFELAGLELKHYEGWRNSYAITLELWLGNLLRNRSRALRVFRGLKDRDPRTLTESAEFYFRIWEFYLMSAKAAFLSGTVRVGQSVLTTAQNTGFPEGFPLAMT